MIKKIKKIDLGFENTERTEISENHTINTPGGNSKLGKINHWKESKRNRSLDKILNKDKKLKKIDLEEPEDQSEAK